MSRRRREPESLVSERLVTVPANAERTTFVPLAFALNPGYVAAEKQITVVSWSQEAHAYLLRLQDAARAQKLRLPIRALRVRLEMAEPTILRLDSELGIPYSDRAREPGTLLWCGSGIETLTSTLCEAISGWLINDVEQIIGNGKDSIAARDALLALTEADTALQTIRRLSTAHIWQSYANGTAQSLKGNGFADLADAIARHVEGKIVFPELPAMRRVARGELGDGSAELITEPVVLSARSRFSLVLEFKVLTFPGRSTPIVRLNMRRRVWASGLKPSLTARRISAYCLPEGETRAFPFTVEQDARADVRPATKGERRTAEEVGYRLGDDAAPLIRRYLEGPPPSLDAIITGGHTLQGAKLLIGQRHGTADRSEIKSGVPDTDKYAAYEALTPLLAEIGLTPWDGLKLTHKGAGVTDMGQGWAEYEGNDDEYVDWRAEMEESIRQCYNGRHHIVIGVLPEDDVHADAQQAERLLDAIMGESVKCTLIPLPPHVHGPRAQLPQSGLKNIARAEVRADAWAPFVRMVREVDERSPVDGILILARRWYGDERSVPDDTINKRVARITLAREVGKPVQYLRPRRDEPLRGTVASGVEDPEAAAERAQKREAQEAKQFTQRLMMAWMDLAYKTVGRVRPGMLAEKAEALYPTETPSFFSAYPDVIMGLGVIRRNTSRTFRNERSFLPYAIEITVATGMCRAAYAYEARPSGPLEWTPLRPLPEVLVELARHGPVRLYTPPSTARPNEERDELAVRTQQFFKHMLLNLHRNALNPLAIIDANTTRSMWSWLQDAAITGSNVRLAGGVHEQMAWPRMRLVRVRTDNSPKVLWPATRSVTALDNGEEITMDATKWSEAMLFRLTDTVESDVYLSFGSMLRTGRVLGHSCYREVLGFVRKGGQKRNERRFVAQKVAPFTDAWTTPEAIEITVIRRASDTSDQLAQLVVWLRQCYAHFGAWSTLPAPLFFRETIKEYLADFQFEPEEADGEDGETEGLLAEAGAVEER